MKNRKKNHKKKKTHSRVVSTLASAAFTALILVVTSTFFQGCTKVRLIKARSIASSSPSPSASPSSSLTSGFAIVPGAHISTGTGMMVIGTIGEPVAMPSSGYQTAPNMRVIPGARALTY